MSKLTSLPRNRSLPPLAIALLAAAAPIAAAGKIAVAEEEAKPAVTTEVKMRDLVLAVPNSWKKEEPMSRLRLGQFRIPAVGDEKTDAELAVFSFGASDIESNVRRWISQYADQGRKAKVTHGEGGQGKYVFVELSGTYKKPVGPPVAGKTELVPGSRTLAVILVVPEKGVYYLKLVGLDKTVAAQAKAFRSSFGADADKEQDIKLDEQPAGN